MSELKPPAKRINGIFITDYYDAGHCVPVYTLLALSY